MNKCKILGLLLAAFIGLVGFNQHTVAARPQVVTPFIPPAWHQKLPASARFQLVLGETAVLDKETGLVWEKSPDATLRTWTDAITYAYGKTVGGRLGWRLPTVEELASLVDPTQTSPSLPNGHPFINVQSYNYWSATTLDMVTDWAWSVHFGIGTVNGNDKVHAFYVWCVRGGHGYNAP